MEDLASDMTGHDEKKSKCFKTQYFFTFCGKYVINVKIE